MSDSVTTTTTTENAGFLAKMGKAIMGIPVGILIFLCATGGIFWNEGRTVKTYRNLAEGASIVVSVGAGSVDSSNEGNLVHFSDTTATPDTLSDPEFGVSANAIKFSREVEMYQWKENKEEKKTTTDGKTKTTTTYTYELVWDDSLNNSSSFQEPAGHANPAAIPYSPMESRASVVTVGAFNLSDVFVDQLSNWDDLTVTEAMKAAAPAGVPANLQISGGDWYIGTNPSAPMVGDVKISYRVVNPYTVSIVGAQKGSRVEAYETATGGGYTVNLLDEGSVPAEEMFASAQSSNSMMAWCIRFGGMFALFAGLMMIAQPLTLVSEYIPVIGGFFRMGAALFAGLLAFGCGFVTIALGWIAYRPLLGILLLLLGGSFFAALLVLAIVFGRKAMAKDAEPDAA